MSELFVARSARFAQWASDVGLSKNVFKLAIAEEPLKELVAAAGWAGETDWTLVKKETVEGLTEEAAFARLAQREKWIDPKFYPRLKGVSGIFKILPANVENQLLVSLSLANRPLPKELKLKPADFAAYMIHVARG
jgi:hypothetical protein